MTEQTRETRIEYGFRAPGRPDTVGILSRYPTDTDETYRLDSSRVAETLRSELVSRSVTVERDEYGEIIREGDWALVSGVGE